MDFGSPSALVNEGCKLFLGIDPFGEALKWVTGDWDAYTDCGTVWANLGKACRAVADNIKSGNDTLAGSWDGNAADSAWAYFDELQAKLREVEEGFSSLDGHYFQVAHFIFSLAEILKAGLAIIVGRIITAMVFQAAAIAASATGVGAIAGAASAALAASQARKADGTVHQDRHGSHRGPRRRFGAHGRDVQRRQGLPRGRRRIRPQGGVTVERDDHQVGGFYDRGLTNLLWSVTGLSVVVMMAVVIGLVKGNAGWWVTPLLLGCPAATWLVVQSRREARLLLSGAGMAVLLLALGAGKMLSVLSG
jgi:hypothetical protein